jgi:hypothetical protein
MRSALATLVTATLLGCGTTKEEVDAATNRWKQRIATEIPIGTQADTARQWFEKQGLKPYSPVLATGSDAKDIEVLLESVPAWEWVCDMWMIRVLAKVSPEAKVAQYDFSALGRCI